MDPDQSEAICGTMRGQVAAPSRSIANRIAGAFRGLTSTQQRADFIILARLVELMGHQQREFD